MDKEASTSGVRVYFTIPFVTPSLGGIMIFLFPDSKSKANADKSISLPLIPQHYYKIFFLST